MADDGLTRDSLSEFDAPEPVLLATASPASMEEPDRPHAAGTAVHHHHHHRVAQPTAEQKTPQVLVKSAPRRNLVVSFVYWWNGWVIDTFHTKVGTVLLDKIGAKT